MIEFQKVSYEQFLKDFRAVQPFSALSDAEVKRIWENIKLPKRGSMQSAGYDFFAPFTISFTSLFDGSHRKDELFPTGIRWITDRNDLVLLCLPRSGSGFKFGVSLLNTTGVIDCDYWKSDNEGHIMCKMQSKYDCTIEEGKGFMQGIITNYFTTDDDVTTDVRNGGFGSTDER